MISRRAILTGLATSTFLPCLLAPRAASAAAPVAWVVEQERAGPSTPCYALAAVGQSSWPLAERCPGAVNLIYPVALNYLQEASATPLFATASPPDLIRVVQHELGARMLAALDGPAEPRAVLLVTLASNAMEREAFREVAGLLGGGAARPIVIAPHALKIDAPHGLVISPMPRLDEPDDVISGIAGCVRVFWRFSEGAGIVGVDWSDLEACFAGVSKAVFAQQALLDSDLPDHWRRATCEVLEFVRSDFGTPARLVLALSDPDPNLHKLIAALQVAKHHTPSGNIVWGAWADSNAPSVSVIAAR